MNTEELKAREGVVYDPTQDCKLVGAARALGGVKDAVTIVHGRPGCHCGVLLLRALGSNQNDIRIVSSGLRAQDMVYGAEGRLMESIRLSYNNFKPALIAVLNCSAPAIMGDDVEGVVHVMKDEIAAEIFSLSTGGYEGPAWLGYEETLAELTRFMVRSETETEKDKINLVGFKQDDFKAYSDFLEIQRMLNGQGIAVNTVLTNSRFAELKNAPDASLNVVLGGDGLESAKIMQEKFDTPYVVAPYPFGLNNSIEFLDCVTTGLNKEINRDFISAEKEKIKERVERIFLFLQGIYDTSVAVVGDGGRAFDFARFLSDELGLYVKVLAITSRNHVSGDKTKCDYVESLLMEPDRFEMNEEIRKKGVEMIFGSSMEKKLAHELGAPLVRIFYPIIDEVSVSDAPYAGFRGVLQLTEKVVNAIINNYTEM
uniref:Light-independent protochlorophyllide reductase subunit B n=1 Tax=Candidatus Methanophagaceae archaeon ANME-1 ERB6 TaxID=2759912 RepID=A0A7G9Z0M7_9EURY|nr:light-independent protochlorophyllide reductase subunit B [Methanosarcinales archaeon ANME-1 ERB6]